MVAKVMINMMMTTPVCSYKFFFDIVSVDTDYWTIDHIIHTSKVNIYRGSN